MNKLLYLFSLTLIILLASCGGGDKTDTVEATEPAESPAAVAVDTGAAYSLVPAQSLITWVGANKFTSKRHEGEIKFSEGRIFIANNSIARGNLLVDMASISNKDLAGTEGEGKLVGHLKSADFFDVENHPTATFEIISVNPVSGNDSLTHEITGNMTIKGITKQITVPAKVQFENGAVKATSNFVIDRSQWDVRYGSESFFPDLMRDKIIKNEIELRVDLVAQAQA